MPELPDLQAFSRNLTKRLIGQKVEKIQAINTKKLNTSQKELQQAITQATLVAVAREGKELHFAFDNGHILGVHLMLRGQLFFFQHNNDNRFTILEILFSKGTGLAVTDRMAQATVTLNPEVREAPDALSADYKFLNHTITKSKTTIKKLITDQKIIRGIGNAYADEILWHARISPFSVCNKIPDAAIKKLTKAITEVFDKAEKSILKADPEIIGGEVRDFLLIHHPEKKFSPTKSEIKVSEAGGRKTYYTDEQILYK